MIGRWFSPGTPVSSTNKPDRQDIAEILLKVALNTIILILIVSTNCFTANQLLYISFQLIK